MLKPTPRSLRALCDALGGDLVDLVVAPRGLDHPVDRIVLHDPLDPPGIGLSTGDLVLAVGSAGYDQATGDLIRAAGAAGAVAVVLRRHAKTPDAVLSAAQRAGLAVLAISQDLSWSELDGLLHAWWETSHTIALPSASWDVPAGLFELADAAAESGGGPVTIEDMQGNVLAFSGGGQEVDPVRVASVMNRRVPAPLLRQLHSHGVFARLTHTDDVIDVCLPGAPPRRAVPIRTGGVVVGVIWLVPDPRNPRQADTVLREVARMAALRFTRDGVRDSLESRIRGNTMAMLLRGGGELGWALDRLGLPRHSGLVVLALAAAPTPGSARHLDQLLDVISVHLGAYRRTAAGAVVNDRLYVLATVNGDESARLLRCLIDGCLARARRSAHGDLRAGMSGLLTGWAELPYGRRDADRAMELGGAVNRVVSIEEVHGRALVADVRDFLHDQGLSRSRQLRALLAHDEENGTAYVATLRAFLDARSDAVLASAPLNIHVNTLRYRIRRILEITGADLADPDTRLGLELELRALRDHPGSPPYGVAAPASAAPDPR